MFLASCRTSYSPSSLWLTLWSVAANSPCSWPVGQLASTRETSKPSLPIWRHSSQPSSLLYQGLPESSVQFQSLVQVNVDSSPPLPFPGFWTGSMTAVSPLQTRAVFSGKRLEKITQPPNKFKSKHNYPILKARVQLCPLIKDWGALQGICPSGFNLGQTYLLVCT